MRSTETVMEMNSRYARAFIRLFPRIRIFKMAIPASKSAEYKRRRRIQTVIIFLFNYSCVLLRNYETGSTEGNTKGFLTTKWTVNVCF
jgi:hypothetical protein